MSRPRIDHRSRHPDGLTAGLVVFLTALVRDAVERAVASDVGHAAYERILAGTLNGDTHENMVEEARRIAGLVLGRSSAPFSYPRESWRPAKVNRLAAVGRWYQPLEAA